MSTPWQQRSWPTADFAADEHASRGYGAEPEAVLRTARLARPSIGPAEVLVRVLASSVDRGTWHMMAGLPYAIRPVSGLRKPKLPNPGRNIAGVVEAVGPEVTGFAPGDEVYGTRPNGSSAHAPLPGGHATHQRSGLPADQQGHGLTSEVDCFRRRKCSPAGGYGTESR